MRLFAAIIKAEKYLAPFFKYDFDLIYSLKWDTEVDGGAGTATAVTADGSEIHITDAGSDLLRKIELAEVEERAGRGILEIEVGPQGGGPGAFYN